LGLFYICMIYIIDANNLAGKLKMLGHEDFDMELLFMLEEYNRERQKRFILVFDGQELMGDKREYGKITLVRSPKDKYFESADDMVVELVKVNLGLLHMPTEPGEQVTVITDDIGLRKRVEKIMEQYGKKLFLMRVTEFADKLLTSKTEEEKEDLSEDEMDKISRDLLAQWKDK